jgi:hypothetical protein
MISSRRRRAPKARGSRVVVEMEDCVHLQQVNENPFTNSEAHPASDATSTGSSETTLPVSGSPKKCSPVLNIASGNAVAQR